MISREPNVSDNGPITVSVLMACYNAQHHVCDALESLARQTFADFNVVVVDDGSTDRSAELIRGFAGNRLRLVQQSNRGAAKARNEAFRHSNGHFVIYMDADDIVAPKHLAALVEKVREEQDCVALSRWGRFVKSPSEATFPSRPTERDLPGPDWLVLDWRDARPMTQSGMVLLPRVLIERHGGWDERLTLHDDFEFFARMIARSNGVRFAPDARLYYRSSVEGSLSRLRTRSAAESAFLSLDLGTRHLLALKGTSEARRACANMLQAFEYDYYPKHADLREKVRARVAELGGANLPPSGPPGFQKLRPWIGWRAARHVQHAAETLGLNGAARRPRGLSGASLRDTL